MPIPEFDPSWTADEQRAWLNEAQAVLDRFTFGRRATKPAPKPVAYAPSIAAMRERLGMTQQMLGMLTGTGAAGVRRVERDDDLFRSALSAKMVAVLEQIAKARGVDLT